MQPADYVVAVVRNEQLGRLVIVDCQFLAAAEQLVQAGAGMHTDEEGVGMLRPQPGEGLRVDGVDLVEDGDGGPVGRAELAEHGQGGGVVLVAVGIAGVKQVDEKIGDHHLLERGLECLDEPVRQAADEADRVGQQQRAAVGQHQLAGGGVEGGEELVDGEDVRAGEPVEQGGFA